MRKEPLLTQLASRPRSLKRTRSFSQPSERTPEDPARPRPERAARPRRDANADRERDADDPRATGRSIRRFFSRRSLTTPLDRPLPSASETRNGIATRIPLARARRRRGRSRPRPRKMRRARGARLTAARPLARYARPGTADSSGDDGGEAAAGSVRLVGRLGDAREKKSLSLFFLALFSLYGRLLSRGNEDISFPNRSTLRLPRPPPRRRRNLPVLPDPRETRPKALRPFFCASSASSRLFAPRSDGSSVSDHLSDVTMHLVRVL